MQTHHDLVRFPYPLWEFLTQPIFSPKKVIWNPLRFWGQYNVQRLEQSWKYDPVQLLERCWVKQIELKDPSSQAF